jgi:hypothetical protein
MCRFGQYSRALNILTNCEGVLAEGPFAQSHELLPNSTPPGISATADPNNVYVRIAHRGGQDYNEGCGAAFASETILRGLFGFEPGTNATLTPLDLAAPRGFTGSLSGLSYQGATYRITSDAKGLSVRPGIFRSAKTMPAKASTSQ